MLKVSTAAINITRDKAKNLEKFLKCIDEAADNGAKLLVLPEQALQGYLTSVIAMDLSGDEEKNEMRFQYVNAEVVPEGPSVQAMIKKAQERDIYVCFGMTERDSEISSKTYNTAVLVGPEGYIGKYRKVHQPADEMQAYYAGHEFPVFDTAIGKLGMMICYDAWFPESGRELALGGAQIILKPTATAHSFPEHNLPEDLAYYSYDLNERATACNNSVYFISSNQIGICGVSDYFGHSNIIAPTGKIMETTGDEEKIVYYEIEDLEMDLFKGRSYLAGLNYMKDRRPSAYKLIAEENAFCNNK